MTLVASGAALTASAQAQTLVDEKGAKAAALCQVADAKRVDTKLFAQFVAGQSAWANKREHTRGRRGFTVTQPAASFRGNKAALPSKPCVACGLAMSWRRRWAKNWAEVKYCSDACRRKGISRG